MANFLFILRLKKNGKEPARCLAVSKIELLNREFHFYLPLGRMCNKH